MIFGGRTCMFLVGVVVGGSAIYALRSKNCRRLLSKAVGKGLQLKDDATALIESIKEDASDIVEEAKHANKTNKA